jgi:hypothetical protein
MTEYEKVLVERAKKNVGYYESELAKAKQKLAELQPPFEPGDLVQPKGNKGLLTVDAVDRAFGAWIVLGHFSRTPERQYCYPVDALEV